MILLEPAAVGSFFEGVCKISRAELVPRGSIAASLAKPVVILTVID